jgi:hypothetical protein
VNFDEVELQTEPVRFWLVSLASNFGPVHLMLYAVVLPDGSVVNRRSETCYDCGYETGI